MRSCSVKVRPPRAAYGLGADGQRLVGVFSGCNAKSLRTVHSLWLKRQRGHEEKDVSNKAPMHRQKKDESATTCLLFRSRLSDVSFSENHLLSGAHHVHP